jgi:hypothetical protein
MWSGLMPTSDHITFHYISNMSQMLHRGAFLIYKFMVSSSGNNAYAVERSENRIVQYDTDFKSADDAMDYIRNKTLIHVPELNNLLLGLSAENKANAINQFCFFDDRYLVYRRYFIGKPPISKIRTALEQRGLRVQILG